MDLFTPVIFEGFMWTVILVVLVCCASRNSYEKPRDFFEAIGALVLYIVGFFGLAVVIRGIIILMSGS